MKRAMKLASALPRLALFAAAALLTPAAAAAQDSAAAQSAASEQGDDAALFDASAFDQDPGAPAAKTEVLAGGSALVSSSAYLPAGLDGYAGSASLSGKVFAKVTVPDYGSIYISYGLYQPFYAGLSGEGSAYAAKPVDLSSPSYSMNELHYSFDLGKKLFLRLGKQLLAWGPSRVWSPVDFVNASKADAFSSIDLRQGKSGLRVHLPMGSYNAFIFADFSRAVSDGAVGNPIDTTLLAARVDGAIGGFELGLSGLLAAHEQDRLGLDFSGDLGGSAVYGELAFAPEYDRYGSSLMASLGFSRSLGDLKRWTVSAEGFYDSLGAELTGAPLAAALASGQASSLYIGKWYGYASLKADELLSPDLATTISVLANLTDLSYQVKLAEDFSIPRSVPFTLSLAYCGGGEGRELTLLGGGDYFSLSVQTRLDF